MYIFSWIYPYCMYHICACMYVCIYIYLYICIYGDVNSESCSTVSLNMRTSESWCLLYGLVQNQETFQQLRMVVMNNFILTKNFTMSWICVYMFVNIPYTIPVKRKSRKVQKKKKEWERERERARERARDRERDCVLCVFVCVRAKERQTGRLMYRWRETDRKRGRQTDKERWERQAERGREKEGDTKGEIYVQEESGELGKQRERARWKVKGKESERRQSWFFRSNSTQCLSQWLTLHCKLVHSDVRTVGFQPHTSLTIVYNALVNVTEYSRVSHCSYNRPIPSVWQKASAFLFNI